MIPVQTDHRFRSKSIALRRELSGAGQTRRRVRPSCFFAGGTNAGEQEVVHERFASPRGVGAPALGPVQVDWPRLAGRGIDDADNREAETV